MIAAITNRGFTLVLALAMALVSAPVWAFDEPGERLENDTVIAEPAPDWDNPRKVIIQVTSKDPLAVNNAYYNAINIKKFYGQDNVMVEVLFFGPGVRAVLKDSAVAPERVSSLRAYEIDFVVCNNTLITMERSKDDLLPGIRVVTSGLAEIIERRMAGWHYIAP